MCGHRTFDGGRDPLVADGKQPAGRGPGGEPVSRGQPLDQGNEMGLQIGGRMLVRYVSARKNWKLSIDDLSYNKNVRILPERLDRFVPDDGLLHGGQRL